jgi:hypothetical protein
MYRCQSPAQKGAKESIADGSGRDESDSPPLDPQARADHQVRQHKRQEPQGARHNPFSASLPVVWRF